MFYFDLQMFDEEVAIEGVDADIASEVMEEVEDTAVADTDSVKKEEQEEVAPEQHVEETEEPQDDGSPIPYARFKSINERMKAAEARVKELEQRTAEPAMDNVSPAPVQEMADEFDTDALTRISQIAVKNVREKMNLSDDDIDAMEYSDDRAQMYAYNSAVNDEIGRIKTQVREHMMEQQRYSNMLDSVAMEFAKRAEAFNAQENSKEIWDYMVRDVNGKPPAERVMLNDALTRLQTKKGTYQDLYVINDYLDKATAAYNKKSEVPNNLEKMKSVSGLPKAPSVAGATSGDTVYSAETIAEIMNQPDGWEKLPADVQQKILRGAL